MSKGRHAPFFFARSIELDFCLVLRKHRVEDLATGADQSQANGHKAQGHAAADVSRKIE